MGSGIGWVRDRGERAGLRTGPVSAWVGAHKTLLRAAAVGVAALIFVFWGQPSLAVVIWLVVLLLVAARRHRAARRRDAHRGRAGESRTGEVSLRRGRVLGQAAGFAVLAAAPTRRRVPLGPTSGSARTAGRW